MSRNLMIGLAVAAVVVVGGGAAYLLTKEDEKPSGSTSHSSDESSEHGFNPASTEGLEFSATITTEGAGVATLEHDDQGNTRYVASAGGQEMEIIYTSDAYYSCQGDNCVKFPLSQSSSSGFNPDDYKYGDAKLAQYRNSAVNKGHQDCPSGECDVWETSAGGITSTIYIDTETGYITQVETTVGGKTSKIVYDYKDVTITVPANARTITTPSQ